MGAIAGLVGPAISIGSSLFGMSKGTPAQNVQLPAPSSYQLPQMDWTAGQYTGGTQALQQQYNPLYQQLAAQGQQASNSLYNNPFASLFQGGSMPAMQLGTAGALAQYGLGSGLAGAGGQALNTGFDPQNALYDRTAQRLQDQQRQANVAAGVGTTPYGAGLEGQTLSNFNIDWNNQQLQRQLAALTGAGGAYSTGAGLMASAPGQYLASAGMPYNTFQTIGGNQLGALGAAGGLYNTAQQGQNLPLQNYMSYLGVGNQANSVANQAASNQLAQAQLGFNQQQTLGNQFGQALQGLGQGWGKSGLPSIGSAIGWGSPSAATSGYNTTGGIYG